MKKVLFLFLGMFATTAYPSLDNEIVTRQLIVTENDNDWVVWEGGLDADLYYRSGKKCSMKVFNRTIERHKHDPSRFRICINKDWYELVPNCPIAGFTHCADYDGILCCVNLEVFPYHDNYVVDGSGKVNGNENDWVVWEGGLDADLYYRSGKKYSLRVHNTTIERHKHNPSRFRIYINNDWYELVPDCPIAGFTHCADYDGILCCVVI